MDINAPVKQNLAAIAKANNKSIEDVTVIILDRPRHEQLIARSAHSGARIRLIPDGDVAGALMTAWPDSGIDVLLGIGGTPEGVLISLCLACDGRRNPGEDVC